MDSSDKIPTSQDQDQEQDPEASSEEYTSSESGYGSDALEFLEDSGNTSDIVSDVDMDTDSSTSSDEPPRKKKKLSGKRCEVCQKRLTISNQYQCRCGKWFCSPHRYAESHDCSFDYKEEGRRIIAKANPVVVAKKIDKI